MCIYLYWYSDVRSTHYKASNYSIVWSVYGDALDTVWKLIVRGLIEYTTFPFTWREWSKPQKGPTLGFFLSMAQQSLVSQGCPHYRGFTITLRHITLGRDRRPCHRRDLNAQSQLASGRIHRPRGHWGRQYKSYVIVWMRYVSSEEWGEIWGKHYSSKLWLEHYPVSLFNEQEYSNVTW